jgi:hypothetical protein
MNKTKVLPALKRHALESNKMFYYHGLINQEIVIHSVSLIEHSFKLLMVEKSTLSRIKTIAIEMFQNISKHQISSHLSPPEIGIDKENGDYIICSTNVIEKSQELKIRKIISKFQEKDFTELKKFYLNKLGEAKVSEQGNAGLGILTIFYRSHKKVAVDFVSISDKYTNFSVKAHITLNSTYEGIS